MQAADCGVFDKCVTPILRVTPGDVVFKKLTSMRKRKNSVTGSKVRMSLRQAVEEVCENISMNEISLEYI